MVPRRTSSAWADTVEPGNRPQEHELGEFGLLRSAGGKDYPVDEIG